MPLIPRIPAGPLLPGQATLNLQGLLQPPKPRLRRGPSTKEAVPRSQRVLGRKYIRGVNEQETIKALAEWRIRNDEEGIGEPGDQERIDRPIIQTNGGVEDELDGLADTDYDDYVTRRRYSYSREYNTDERITVRYAARKLCIPRSTFRGWIKKKSEILRQKKGTFRVRKPWGKVKELNMELKLKERFDEARLKGRAISAK
ncbi:hypothetical protein ACEPPN_001653 [Leptodophora sp. 'Broadleaf-Isolate-01']